MNLFAIFLTGLTSGGVSCASVQGGLLASIIANQKKLELDQNPQEANSKLNQINQLDWLPVSIFLIAKLISHTLFGFALGSLGTVLSVSQNLQVLLQIITALFIFATAMNFLDVHPLFRHLAFTAPKFIRRMIKSSSQNNAIFAPFILGLLSILIPCGVTQSMEVLAMSSGSAMQGALIMASFVLGTMPIFALLGITTAKLTESWRHQFNKWIAYILIALAAYSFNAALVALNAPLTLQKMWGGVTWFFSDERFSGQAKNPGGIAQQVGNLQKVRIDIKNNGYEPKYIKVKKDIPVELTLASGNVYSCAQSFVFREFAISAMIHTNSEQTFTFTPKKKGKFTFSCSMGMYTGTLEVI